MTNNVSIAIGDPCKNSAYVFAYILDEEVSYTSTCFSVTGKVSLWKSGVGTFKIFYAGKNVGTVTSESGYLAVMNDPSAKEGYYVHEIACSDNDSANQELLDYFCKVSFINDEYVIVGEEIVITQGTLPDDYKYAIGDDVFRSSGAVIFNLISKLGMLSIMVEQGDKFRMFVQDNNDNVEMTLYNLDYMLRRLKKDNTVKVNYSLESVEVRKLVDPPPLGWISRILTYLDMKIE